MLKLLLVIVVFLLVFNPKKLPLFFANLSNLNIKFNEFKKNIMDFWHEKMEKEFLLQKLQDNKNRASEVDALYKAKKNINND